MAQGGKVKRLRPELHFNGPMRHRRHVMCSSRCVNWLGEDLLSHFHRRKRLVKVKPQCGTLLSLRQRKPTPRRHYAPPTESCTCVRCRFPLFPTITSPITQALCAQRNAAKRRLRPATFTSAKRPTVASIPIELDFVQ